MRALMKKYWLLMLLLLMAAVCLLPIPRRMNVTQEGILWRCGAPEEMQTTPVTVKGIYYDYLLLADKFDGSVRVEALPETQGELSMAYMGENQYGVWIRTEDALLKGLGGLYVRPDGSVLMNLYDDGHWDGATGKMLTAPASTRAEAVALANEMAQSLSPDWLGAKPFE